MKEELGGIYGFSSYAREMRSGVQPRSKHVESGLRDALAPIPFLLYLDVAEHSGQRTGLWPNGLVQAIARASLFIWWQSPKWFASATCRWELRCFLARADRIAETIGAPSEAVRSWLIEPVRINAVPEASWALFGPEAQALRDLYENLNVQDRLNCEGVDFDACRAATSHLRCQLDEVLADHGGVRRLAQLRVEDDAFQTEWLEIGRRTGAWVKHEGATIPDPLPTDERRRLALTRRFQREMAVVNSAAPFAMSARTERAEPYAVASRGRDLAGRTLWDAAGADGVEDHARSEGLRLPTRDEGEKMLALLKRPQAERERAGLQEIASDFWCRDAGGEPIMFSARRPCAPIFLVTDGPL